MLTLESRGCPRHKPRTLFMGRTGGRRRKRKTPSSHDHPCTTPRRGKIIFATFGPEPCSGYVACRKFQWTATPVVCFLLEYLFFPHFPVLQEHYGQREYAAKTESRPGSPGADHLRRRGWKRHRVEGIALRDGSTGRSYRSARAAACCPEGPQVC